MDSATPGGRNQAKPPEKILVFHTGSLGDTLLVVPWMPFQFLSKGFKMKIIKIIFLVLASFGRTFGGIRPHRLMNNFGKKIFDKKSLSSGFYKIKTNWGGIMYLHPFYYLDRQVILTGCYDVSLHIFLETYVKPGMICMDVGANIGEITIHISKLVGTTGLVYAFEPVPIIKNRLVENIKLNHFASNIIVVNDALSNKNGFAQFAIADNDVENQGMGSLVNKNNEVVSKEIEVTTIKLDDFVSKNKIKSINIIKVDIQGGEIYFLEGAKNTIQNMSPDIVIEVSESDLACIHKTKNDLLKLVEDLGYKIYLFNNKGLTNKEVTSKDSNNLSLNIFCTKIEN